MKKHLNIKNGIIAFFALISFLVILNPGGHLPNRIEKVVQIDSIPYNVIDTIVVDSLVEVEIEVPIEIEIPVNVTVIEPVDTAEILKVYYNKQVNKEVITLPKNIGTITLTDTISQNKIVGRKIETKVKKEIVRDTLRLPEVPKDKIYIGFDTKMDSPNFFQSIGLGVLYNTKGEKIFKVGAGVDNRTSDRTNGTFTPYVDFGVYWKIKVKKH
jgi:hypothetical protein